MASNADVVRQIYEAFGAAWEQAQREATIDAFPFEEVYDPEVVLEELPFIPGGRSYAGYDGLTQWFFDWFELYEEIRMDVLKLEEAGDKVLVSTHQRLRGRSGVETEQDVVHVWTLRDARVVHLTGFREMAEARAAAGLDG